MEGSGGFFPFGGGDPEDLLGALREFAERQAETVQETQREQFATLTLNTAVELTSAALGQMQVEGSPDAQALALRDAMRVLFPEAVALVSAARQGFMRQVAPMFVSRLQPPSMTTVWPRIMSASGEHRNVTTFATSSGVTMRPTGFRSPISSIASLFGKCSRAPVSTTPAETAFTRIPRGASSTAR